MSDDSPFLLNTLSYFPCFFDEDERIALAKWGSYAAALSNGLVAPASPKEAQFVLATQGQTPPVTRFQKIWVRYLNAVEIQTQLTECEKRLVDITSLLNAANLKNEKLEEDVVGLTKLLASRNLDANANANEGNLPKNHKINVDLDVPLENSSERTEVCSEPQLPGGLPPYEFSDRDETSKDGLRQCTIAAPESLSDNELSTLSNNVDGMEFSSNKTADFNVEQCRRSEKYQPRNTSLVDRKSFFKLIQQYRDHLLLRSTFIKKMEELAKKGNPLASDYLLRQHEKINSKSSDYASGQEWGGAIKRRQYI